MGLFDDLEDTEPTPAPIAVIRSFLAMAIQIGAPAYNAGDHRGCYEVYACTARFLVRAVTDKKAESARELLTAALQRFALEVDVNERAWIMRRAFDCLLNVVEDN